MTKAQMQHEALAHAVQGQSLMNYPAIYQGFLSRGIPESEIRPRENVLTYNAWQALGRQVRKGEHGVKVVTFIECDEKTARNRSKRVGQTVQVEETATGKTYRRPWTTTVFHVSQTDEINATDVDRENAAGEE